MIHHRPRPRQNNRCPTGLQTPYHRGTHRTCRCATLPLLRASAAATVNATGAHPPAACRHSTGQLPKPGAAMVLCTAAPAPPPHWAPCCAQLGLKHMLSTLSGIAKRCQHAAHATPRSNPKPPDPSQQPLPGRRQTDLPPHSPSNLPLRCADTIRPMRPTTPHAHNSTRLYFRRPTTPQLQTLNSPTPQLLSPPNSPTPHASTPTQLHHWATCHAHANY